MITVRIAYKYGTKGQKPIISRPSETIQAEAKTESAVIAALRRKYPAYGEIIILKIQ